MATFANVAPAAETPLAGDESGLLTRAKEGERRAFFALFQAHARRIYSLCLTVMGDFTAAENLTRDIFIEAFTSLDNIDDEAEFAARLYIRAAKKVFASRRKRRYPVRFWASGWTASASQFRRRGEPAPE